MALQIFGTKKCQETKKAERWLKERGIAFHFVDLGEKGISPGELRSLRECLGLESLVDVAGKRYKERGIAYLQTDLEEEILADPLLLRTPLIREGRRALLGFDPKALAAWGLEPQARP